MHKTFVVALVALIAVAGSGIEPAAAEEGQGFLSSRRSLGLVFMGSSLILAKQGLDFRDEADKLYSRYKRADSPEDADRLYARTNNRDIKSQVSWALAAAFAVSGTRLLLKGSGDAPTHEQKENRQMVPTLGYSLEPQVESRRFGLTLKRTFY